MQYHDRKLNCLPGYDYKQPGYYFVTICAKRRNTGIFGDIRHDTVILNLRQKNYV